MAKINRVERVSLSGGIIGALATNPRSAIERKCNELNAEGWNCRQIMPHSTRNLFVLILQNIILVCTLFLWTFGAGYILLFEKEVNSGSVPQKNTENTSSGSSSGLNLSNIPPINPIKVNTGDTWVCKKCSQTNPNTSSTCKDCGEYK
jgi:hypothetical protein